ncbi:type II toxin-antitoxin system RelE/ParE family toxin [Desulfovibrio sp. JC022]|uniref:type II toxin-antitoxin system RelE/ParE family toxin n=1 Tax=Desulfovibrio sp. JC022 TaxID=2593642 RepID=UPI0013D7F025|nr:type II toxin-antitoxin system RelE/ParE family toxin [Desulfovibrio sp. JC022]NDV22765.1 type II toxin-antitoxin system RelE/ParE family toxin [Desulfovibrio sp. JC022]
MKVRLTEAANQDLQDIVHYIKQNDCKEQANKILDRLENSLYSLQQLPSRGVRVRELFEFGLNVYREIFCDCYRIIYKVNAETVRVYLIVDKRRDLVPLLTQRLID